MNKLIHMMGLLFVVSACSPSQTQQVITDVNLAQGAIASACALAQQDTVAATALAKGGAANTVSNIAAYVNTSCGTATAIASLANDPASLAWVQSLSTKVKAAVSP